MYDAVILAGGKGTRLRPITNGLPKPLVNVGTESVLWHVLSRLERMGTRLCALTLGYEAEQIKKRFGGSFGNMRLEYFTEDEPLGSAGGVKAAAGVLSTESFLVLSGDGMFDLDLDELIRFHEKSGAMLSIGTYFCKDPTEYGAVVTDKDGKVVVFAEKAPWSATVTGNVNTGIYAVKKSAIELIPEKKAWDFARDLFPLLMKEQGLYAKALRGYWCDVGSAGALLSCNMDLLSSRLRAYAGERSDGSIYGRDCTVKKGAVIKNCVIGNGCVIGEGAELTGTLLLDGVYVGAECRLKDCVVGALTELPEKKSFAGKAIGSGGEVKSISEDKPSFRFTDKGIAKRAQKGDGDFLRLGEAICKACGKGKLGILNDGSESSKEVARQIIEAAAGFGARCAYDFGTGFDAQSAFAAYSYGLSASVFVKSDGEDVYVKLYDSSTAPVCRDFERELKAALSGTDAPKTALEPVRTHGLSPRYTDALIKSVYGANMGVFSLDGLAVALDMRPSLACVRAALSLLDAELYTPEKAESIFDKNGAEYMDAYISDDGFGLEISYGGKVYKKELVCAILARDAAGRGERELPVLYEREPELLWASDKLHVESFPSSPLDARQSLARFNARRSLWMKDASFMLLRLAAVIKSRNRDLSALASELEGIYRREESVYCERGRAYTIERLLKKGGSYGKEGIVFEGIGSRASVTCNRDESLRIITYGTNTEAARALCEDIKSKINEIL